MSKSLNSFENRVRRLERLNHLLMISCVALASVPVLIGAGSQGAGQPRVQLPPNQLGTQIPLPPAAQKYMSKQIQDMLAAERQVQNVVRTRVLALVDKDGKTKAVLATDEQGNPMLTMLGVRDAGRSTAISMTLGLVANQPECVFYGYDDRPIAGLYALGEAPYRVPMLSFLSGGQILMKHANGNVVQRFMSSGDVARWEVNDKEGKNALNFSSGGAPASRITDLTLTAANSGNTARVFAGPSQVAISVNSKGTKYYASMSAEGTQGTLRGRSRSGPQDQVFSSKWRDPLHDVHGWMIELTDPW